MFLLVYIDDILITGNNESAISNLLINLNSQFSMKHLGPASQFFGISIQSTKDTYFLSQSAYALSILQQTNLAKCNSLSNPSVTKQPSNFKPDNTISDATVYRRITRGLQYLTITRPDIAHSVNNLAQHMHDPAPVHLYLLKPLLRYIKGTINFGLPIIKSKLQLRTFSDANWAGDPITKKSTTGFCTFLGENLVSWTVKKQTTVSRSSTESEYRALAAATADIIWMRRLIADFNISHNQPISIYCDNTSAIALANNPVFHVRTKHIEIDQRLLLLGCAGVLPARRLLSWRPGKFPPLCILIVLVFAQFFLLFFPLAVPFFYFFLISSSSDFYISGSALLWISDQEIKALASPF
ncbi:uncharacterized protein LOC110096260 [Dendrobium catenatum]|uniref:uncharacterized protein LOC110096260 n=1 Tax=Dendrobium catenatum TaxID=906689 RepID=UPI0009F66702|nr:uncharacterized protein LOC110096260 [Dendrobium catenatum]